MWFTGIANWCGGLAHYSIFQQGENSFHAILKKYDGREDKTPPGDFILTRGNKHWEGTIKDHSILDQLGAVIDTRLRGRLFNQIQDNTGNYRNTNNFH